MFQSTSTTQMIRSTLAICGFILLTGAKGACFYTGPDTVVYERGHGPVYGEPMPGESVIVEETITENPDGSTVIVTETTTTIQSMPVYLGDLMITYDFGGFTCMDMDIWSFDLALYDVFGQPIVMDFDLPCDIFSEMHIEDLEMGPYTLTLIGRDIFGYEMLIADVEFDHVDWFTPLHLSL